jgi:DNA-binding NarL/FixJ family response regulator
MLNKTAAPPAQIKVLIVDDHALVRQAVGQCLQNQRNIDVVGSAGDADEAIELALEHRPHIILMDIDMPGLNCFDAVRRITSMAPHVKVIFLSAFSHDRYIEQALSVRANGYLSKHETTEKIVEAIREVAAGRAYFSEQVRSRLVIDADGVHLQSASATRASTLSPRELEVLRYVAAGLSKKEIASTMHISVKTVENHTASVMTKLEIHDRVGLARYAIREGLAQA